MGNGIGGVSYSLTDADLTPGASDLLHIPGRGDHGSEDVMSAGPAPWVTRSHPFPYVPIRGGNVPVPHFTFDDARAATRPWRPVRGSYRTAGGVFMRFRSWRVNRDRGWIRSMVLRIVRAS